MSIALLQNITKSYGAELIFSGVSFRVDGRDRIGLVGPNGAGKTTLLGILSGALQPDQGTFSLAEGTTVGYLPQIITFDATHSLYEEMLSVFAEVHQWEQELHQLAARMAEPETLDDADAYQQVLERYADLLERFEHAGGYTTEQRVRQVLDGLGFSRAQQSAPATQLSGGQQTRAALGKLLLQQPQLLLLDEPTNHLDLMAIEWLEEYLTSWDGAFILVSHDRYFLDRVTQRTIDISHGRAELYPGNYSNYLRLRAERLVRWQREYEEQQEYIARTEDFIRRYKAGQRSREARGRQTLLDRMERIARPPSDRTMTFRISPTVQPGQVVLSTENLVVGFSAPRTTSAGGLPEATLRVQVPDTEIMRGDRIGLIGANGGGKTTLLRTLIGHLQPLQGRAIRGHNVRIGYYAQTHEHLDENALVIDEVRNSSHLSPEGARTYLGRFLFTGDDALKTVSALSGGERSRLALAKLTLEGANLLVLDEPTNHLDLPSREALEQILAAFDGTLIFVSHDRYFTDALASTLWVLQDGAVTIHRGNYTSYRTRRSQSSTAPERETVSLKQRNPNTTRASAASHGQSRSIEHVEADIQAAEAVLRDLEQALVTASEAGDVAHIADLGTQYDAAKEHLDSLYAEWEGLAG